MNFAIPTPILAAGMFIATLFSVVGLLIAGEPVPDEIKALLTLFAGAVVGSVAPASVGVRK